MVDCCSCPCFVNSVAVFTLVKCCCNQLLLVIFLLFCCIVYNVGMLLYLLVWLGLFLASKRSLFIFILAERNGKKHGLRGSPASGSGPASKLSSHLVIVTTVTTVNHHILIFGLV